MRILEFGSHRFELGTGRLWSGPEELRLTPKASAVLEVLVTRAGHPVTKDELFQTVWTDTAVSDYALTSCIRELRRTLGDDAKSPRFIETRHRLGYRFVAPLSDTAARPEAEVATSPPDISAIAVLPFVDMSPERDQDHLCEGLADELINALTQVEGLRVASRTASFQFRGPGADIRSVGRHLRVGTLLAGSVRMAGNRLRVTVQLIEISSGYHRWSQRFDRTLGDIFAVQDEIAESVAASLRGGVLADREKLALARPHTGIDAYESYLRARQLVPLYSQSDLERSAGFFRRSIELDPAYAPAWAGLSTIHAILYEWFGARDEDLAGADTTSRRALELAPGLADAHSARGYALSLSRRYDEAVREFDEAIRINPHLFDAYYYFARANFACGDVQRSAELFARAAEVRKEDFQSALLLAQSLRMSGRTAESRRAGREGIARAERALALNPRDGRALSLGSGGLYWAGQEARAVDWAQRALELYPDDLGVLLNGACLFARMGRKDEALDLVERVFARGWGHRAWVERDPDFGVLRDEPRFRAILASLH
jgi:TolB-like protein/tetratricopeptide (TPR) repeat protein